MCMDTMNKGDDDDNNNNNNNNNKNVSGICLWIP